METSIRSFNGPRPILFFPHKGEEYITVSDTGSLEVINYLLKVLEPLEEDPYYRGSFNFIKGILQLPIEFSTKRTDEIRELVLNAANLPQFVVCLIPVEDLSSKSFETALHNMLLRPESFQNTVLTIRGHLLHDKVAPTDIHSLISLANEHCRNPNVPYVDSFFDTGFEDECLKHLIVEKLSEEDIACFMLRDINHLVGEPHKNSIGMLYNGEEEKLLIPNITRKTVEQDIIEYKELTKISSPNARVMQVYRYALEKGVGFTEEHVQHTSRGLLRVKIEQIVQREKGYIFVKLNRNVATLYRGRTYGEVTTMKLMLSNYINAFLKQVCIREIVPFRTKAQLIAVLKDRLLREVGPVGSPIVEVNENGEVFLSFKWSTE